MKHKGKHRSAPAWRAIFAARNGIAVGVLITVGIVMESPALAQNLLANPGFETGDFSGWTLQGDQDDDFVDTSGDLGPTYTAHSGDWFGALGSEGEKSTLTQTVPTTPGHLYNINFWLGSGSFSSLPPNFFSATFAGVTGFSQVNLLNSPNTTYTFQVTATGASEDLQFTFRNDNDFFTLDDASVTDASMPLATPEPGIIALLAGAMLSGGGLLLQTRRQGKRTGVRF